jgi:hypothetical protein
MCHLSICFMPSTMAFVPRSGERAPGRAGNPERLLPPSGPGRKRQEVGEVVVVVDVQVGDKNVIDLRRPRRPWRACSSRAGAEVEEEAIAVARR